MTVFWVLCIVFAVAKHDIQAVGSPLQNTRIQVRGLLVYGNNRYDPRTVGTAPEISGVTPRSFKRSKDTTLSTHAKKQCFGKRLPGRTNQDEYSSHTVDMRTIYHG